MRSSTSTVRGKKSIPSRMPREAWAVTRTVVSPTDITTAPSACWANNPVEKVRDLPESPMGADTEIGPVMGLLLSSLSSGAEPVPSRHLPGVPHPGRWRLTTDRRHRQNRSRSGSALLEKNSLPAEPESGDECPVPLDVVPSEVVEQTPPLANEHEQPAAGVMVLLVDLQVRREHVDAPGQERDLHLRRAGVGLVEAVLADRGGGVRHLSDSFSSGAVPYGNGGLTHSRVRIAAADAATAEPTIRPFRAAHGVRAAGGRRRRHGAWPPPARRRNRSALRPGSVRRTRPPPPDRRGRRSSRAGRP